MAVSKAIKQSAVNQLKQYRGLPLVFYLSNLNKKNRTVRIHFAVQKPNGDKYDITNLVCIMNDSMSFNLGLLSSYSYGRPFIPMNVRYLNKHIAEFENVTNYNPDDYIFSNSKVIVNDNKVSRFFDNREFGDVDVHYGKAQ